MQSSGELFSGREEVMVSHLQFGDESTNFLLKEFQGYNNVLTILYVFEVISSHDQFIRV